ncbi:MAG: phosphoribosylamine--glycine ligase [Phycisphaerales bacterium]
MNTTSHRQPPQRCNILLVGGGGREHALAWKLSQSQRLGKLWLTDDRNAGLQKLGQTCPVKLDLRAPFHIKNWLAREAIDLIVVGPEGPLAEGVADVLGSEKCLVFGPGREGAMLEADKAWAKAFMRGVAIPTADSRSFNSRDAAVEYARSREHGMVVKAAGLAAGKGVIVCSNPAETVDAIEHIMTDGAFGKAGETIVIEEKLSGQEVSVMALTDGRSLWMLDPCQDHKQLGEGDTGPNTGGMGAYSPTPVADEQMLANVEREVFVAALDGLKRQGIDYRGVLYAGLMLTHAGPRVLEFNCRFGDPECQVLMVRLQSDLIELLWATCTRGLSDVDVVFDERVACTVVMCSEGYPGTYETGKVITGIDEAAAMDDVVVFHSGTAMDEAGNVITHGGRVLSVTALGADLQSARDLANRACELIHFEGAVFRRDIGNRVLLQGGPEANDQTTASLHDVATL